MPKCPNKGRIGVRNNHVESLSRMKLAIGLHRHLHNVGHEIKMESAEIILVFGHNEIADGQPAAGITVQAFGPPVMPVWIIVKL
jgi:hypothetical protein